eukprot:gene8920-1263_t
MNEHQLFFTRKQRIDDRLYSRFICICGCTRDYRSKYSSDNIQPFSDNSGFMLACLGEGAFNLSCSTSGRLETRKDVGLFLLALVGYDVSHDIILDILHAHPSGVRRQDAHRIAHQLPTGWFPSDKHSWHHCFVAIDRTGQGFLTTKDVICAGKQAAPGLSVPSLLSAFSLLDSDGDGRLALADTDRIQKKIKKYVPAHLDKCILQASYRAIIDND